MSEAEQNPSGDMVFYVGERAVHRVQANAQTNDWGFINMTSAAHGATHILLPPAPPVMGHWVYDHGHGIMTSIGMHRRPNWLIRWAMRVVLDIHWRDA
jgi:hypothetical protein